MISYLHRYTTPALLNTFSNAGVKATFVLSSDSLALDNDLLLFLNSILVQGHKILQIATPLTVSASSQIFDSLLGSHSNLVAPAGGVWTVGDLISFQNLGIPLALYNLQLTFPMDNASNVSEGAFALARLSTQLSQFPGNSFIGLLDGYDSSSIASLGGAIALAQVAGLNLTDISTCIGRPNLMISSTLCFYICWSSKGERREWIPLT